MGPALQSVPYTGGESGGHFPPCFGCPVILVYYSNSALSFLPKHLADLADLSGAASQSRWHAVLGWCDSKIRGRDSPYVRARACCHLCCCWAHRVGVRKLTEDRLSWGGRVSGITACAGPTLLPGSSLHLLPFTQFLRDPSSFSFRFDRLQSTLIKERKKPLLVPIHKAVST